MSADKELWGLRLFGEKVEKLWGLSLTETILNGPSGFRMSYDHETGTTAERYGSSEESIDAFVLTLRFFIQDNGSCSLRNVTKHIDALHAAGLASDEIRDKWNEARDAISTYLDAETCISEQWEKDAQIVREEIYIHRRIMEVFVYGGLGHASREKKILFDSWRAKPFFFPMMENEFGNVIGIWSTRWLKSKGC